MFIYVGGTYSRVPARGIRFKRGKVEEENIKKINEAAIEIAKKGHVPFIPFTRLRDWQDTDEEPFRQICNNCLKQCNAVYFIKQPSDAESESERQLAISRNLPIYYNLDDIPQALPSKLSSEAFQAYLVEYQQCMQNFRHIYATIWQAGALFAAISAGIIAFAGASIVRSASFAVPPLIQVLAPIPVIFWYLGIYRPMNRYCEQDNDRLVQIEQLLSEAIPGLDMRHFRIFSSSRKGEGFTKRILKFKWLLKPRVVEIVTIFGLALIILEIYLLWLYYLSHWF